MQLSRFYHGHNLYGLSRHPDFYIFELAIWLHTLARSLISIFIPILLLKAGYSISNVIIFYLLLNVIDVPLNFAVDWLIRKIGAKRVMILATLAMIAFFAVLGILPPSSWPLLILLAFLAAAYDTLFWIAHIYIFIETNREGLDTGRTVGALEGIRKFANVVGPLVGAFVLLTIGKVPLIAISIVVFALSIIPLFKLRHARDIPNDKRTPFREFFSNNQEKKNYLSVALWGIHNEAEDILWPLFIFTIFGSIGSVAAVPVIVSLTTAVLSYFAGTLTRRYGNRMIILGSVLIASVWIFRITTQDPILYYVTVFLVGFFSLLVMIPIDGSVTARGLKLESLTTSTYRNAASMALRIPFYLILIVSVEVFKVSFVIAALSLFSILAVTVLLRASGQKYHPA